MSHCNAPSHANDNFASDFKTQFTLNYSDELVVDLFAGGGGASTGLEMGLDRPVDIAINHNPKAISMHMANHPATKHYISDVWAVDPLEATEGRPVGWMHASPDCTHHSQAAGGQPRKKEIRDLSWVVCRWAGLADIRLISLENVKQILNWGPLIAKRDKATGRVITLEKVTDPTTGKKVYRVAEPGERVPRDQQHLIPDPKHKGRTWKQFVRQLEGMGYCVEWRLIKACDYGAPTTRERLFMIARKDGEPIVWPKPTHADRAAQAKLTKLAKKLQKPQTTAADCIDWDNPCPSIFGRKKDLADATLRRIAKGMQRYVLDAAEPFIVPIANWSNGQVQPIGEPLRTITAYPKGGSFSMVSPSIVPLTHQGGDRVHSLEEPLRTVTGANRGELALSSAVLVQMGYGERVGQQPRALNLRRPLGTVTAGGIKHAVASAVLIQAAHGEGKPGGVKRWGSGSKDVRRPVGAITASNGHAVASAVLVGASGPQYAGKPAPIDRPVGSVLTQNHRAVATAFMAQMNGGFNATPARDARQPMSTVTNTGSQQQLVTAHLAHLRNNCDARDVAEPLETITSGGNHHGLVSAFLHRQFGNSVGQELSAPAPTVTAGGGGKSALVEVSLSPEMQEGALRVAAFLMQYYSEGGQWGAVDQPINTITTKDRLALVTVTIAGTPYVIVDIGLRMLQPRELYRAQGFPESYVIEHGHDGTPFTKSDQVHMCGNSVSPLPMAALARANNPWKRLRQSQAA